MIDKILTFLWGSPEGTIRRKRITPKEAIEKNKNEIRALLNSIEVTVREKDNTPDARTRCPESRWGAN